MLVPAVNDVMVLLSLPPRHALSRKKHHFTIIHTIMTELDMAGSYGGLLSPPSRPYTIPQEYLKSPPFDLTVAPCNVS